MDLRSAITAIEKHGILLVYPIDNQKEPPSLWSHFYPRSQMRWEWDQDGDDRVSTLWSLREQLSRSQKVVYAKWYKNRATFFSKDVFTSLLAVIGSTHSPHQGLSTEARHILELLEMDSPLSTKQVKQLTGLRGRALEPTYTKALKELWTRLLVVGYGEIDDGAFPSLAIGSTHLLFEDLWNNALATDSAKAWSTLQRKLPAHCLFLKQLKQIKPSPSPSRNLHY